MAAQETIRLDDLPGWAKLAGYQMVHESLKPAMRACTIAVKAMAKDFFQQSQGPDGTPWPVLKHPRPRTGGQDKPLLDTGVLRSSMAGGASAKGHFERIEDFELEVGSIDQRAALMNFGGTVRPTGGRKYLAIPLSKEATRYSGPRSGPRPFPKALGLVSRPGHPPILVEQKVKGKGKKAKIITIVHYVLVPSVTIPARPFAGFSEAGLKTCEEIIADFTVNRFIK